MLENAQIIWIFQKNILYLPRQKVTFDYPGRIPRGQDHIDTTQKRVSIFMMLTYFFVIIRCLKNKTQIFFGGLQKSVYFCCQISFS